MCKWCGKEGHEDCSPKATFDDIIKAVSSDEAMLRALLQKAVQDDQEVCGQMGAYTACWGIEERGYALMLRDIEHLAGKHTDCNC